jgi:hypothetical protein
MLLHAEVSSADMGRKGPYVYAVVANDFGVIYIGQTLSALGATGRLAQHIGWGAGATFRRRICETFGYEDVRIGPINFAAYPLLLRREFMDDATDYREAVESGVQYELLRRIVEDKVPYVIISRVNRNPLVGLNVVRIEVENAVSAFYPWLQELASTSETVKERE